MRSNKKGSLSLASTDIMDKYCNWLDKRSHRMRGHRSRDADMAREDMKRMVSLNDMVILTAGSQISACAFNSVKY
jgi:hypothetical protein